MNLVLEVMGQNAQSLAGSARKVFGAGGGSIGRAPECDWVLPSPYISRHHATVCCINGVFYIESTGENGVAVNAPQSMLPQLERRALQSGDRLFIDEFEISVGVSVALIPDDAEEQSAVRDPFAARKNGVDEQPIGGGSLDPLLGLAGGANLSTTAPRNESAWNHSSSLADHFTPPSVAAPAPSVLPIAEDWNQTQYDRAPQPPAPIQNAERDLLREPRPTVTPWSPQATQSPIGQSAQSVAQPAPAVHSAPSLSMGEPGAMDAIVRNMVQGLIEVLRARAEFRNQFRLPVTRVRTMENNPLKFAINADDAMDSLTNRRNAGFMPAAEAFEDAFDDIRFHQLAMLAGMRAGFECVMNRFDPQKLQERFDRQLKHSGFLAVASKLRYWDLYADWFEELASDADGAFQRLFGEEFASAYEQQLETLKRSRGNPRHSSS